AARGVRRLAAALPPAPRSHGGDQPVGRRVHGGLGRGNRRQPGRPPAAGQCLPARRAQERRAGHARCPGGRPMSALTPERRAEREAEATAVVAVCIVLTVAILLWPLIVALWHAAPLIVIALAWLLFLPLADRLPENRGPRE